MLTNEGFFQSQRGNFRHSELIGREEGTVFETSTGHRLQALRPLINDYVLSMPRGATVVYPKDAGQIVQQADVFPGARVVEAGLGSGALAMSLLSAVGPSGHLTSVERREDFADIARANVESWFGPELPPWDVRIGDLDEVLDAMEEGSIDTVVLDMLAPWENIESAAHALRSGGVIIGYVATTTQMSRFVEDLRSSGSFTEPESSETLIRTWHLDGLSVRPDHRMVAHTGFLVVARRIGRDSTPLIATKRPAPAAHSEPLAWEAADFGERKVSEKKLRKVRRDIARRADAEQTGSAVAGENVEMMNSKLDAEARERQAQRQQQRAVQEDLDD